MHLGCCAPFLLARLPSDDESRKDSNEFSLSTSSSPVEFARKQRRLIESFAIINFAHLRDISSSLLFLIKGEQPEAMHAGFGLPLKSTTALYPLSLTLLLLQQVISQR
jgi:hypothetical protein